MDLFVLDGNDYSGKPRFASKEQIEKNDTVQKLIDEAYWKGYDKGVAAEKLEWEKEYKS